MQGATYGMGPAAPSPLPSTAMPSRASGQDSLCTIPPPSTTLSDSGAAEAAPSPAAVSITASLETGAGRRWHGSLCKKGEEEWNGSLLQGWRWLLHHPTCSAPSRRSPRLLILLSTKHALSTMLPRLQASGPHPRRSVCLLQNTRSIFIAKQTFKSNRFLHEMKLSVHNALSFPCSHFFVHVSNHSSAAVRQLLSTRRAPSPVLCH